MYDQLLDPSLTSRNVQASRLDVCMLRTLYQQPEQRTWHLPIPARLAPWPATPLSAYGRLTMNQKSASGLPKALLAFFLACAPQCQHPNR